MNFSNIVCWNAEMVQSVMNVEATQPNDAIFLATHYPISMYRQDLTDGESRIEYTEEKFLQDFLATPDFTFVPILGSSGTGKSHLIRWLYIRIKNLKKNNKSCRVLLIPKVGTNLKNIIESILKDMEGQEFDEYRQRLLFSSSSLTEIEARKQLLANLAISVGRVEEEHLIKEGFEDIIQGLPALLNDPYFQDEYWLKEDGVIARLVVHILGQQTTLENLENRREFAISDLPQSYKDAQHASKKAREFYSTIGDDESQQEVVRWLNIHLDEAIAKVLNLGREDLQRLMLDVRRSLAKQNVELILLIEDFAKLQGIDREILETVLAQPRQVTGDPLCSIRTSLACTTGYFKGLVDTVRTRTNFSINLDIDIDNQSLVKQEDVQGLVSRYLNAARLSNQVVHEWAESFELEAHQSSEAIPSACYECDHRDICHAGFGAVSDIGLYPFTAKSIERMHERVNRGIFNPRIIIKEILRYTLEYHSNEIKKGLFPSLLLHQHFGGSRLSAMLTNDIKSRDVPDDTARRAALIDLWTNGNSLHDLDPIIHSAFGLIPLGTEGELPPLDPIITPLPVPVENQLSLLSRLEEDCTVIDAWSNGNDVMPQSLGQKLRELLFEAILQKIDWNSELLLRKKVGEKLFLRRNLTFREINDSLTSSIKLNLPLETDDIGDTAIALQATLIYNHYGHWRFPDGARYFRVYARKLEHWSDYLLDKVRRGVCKSFEAFDPVPSVVEVLAVGSRMAGRGSDLETAVNSLFKDFSSTEIDVSNRARSWRLLFEEISKNRTKLLEILQPRICCVKGTANSSKIIDVSQVIPPLKNIISDWTRKGDVPENLRLEYEVIRKVRLKIDDLLVNAVREEKERQLKVYLLIIQELGEDFSRNDIANSLRETIRTSKDAGSVVGNPNTQELEKTLEEFASLTRIKSYMDNMKRIQNETDTGLLLERLSSTAYSQRTMDIIESLMRQARDFLNNSIIRAKKNIDLLPSGGDLESTFQSIESGLATLNSFAIEIKGDKTL